VGYPKLVSCGDPLEQEREELDKSKEGDNGEVTVQQIDPEEPRPRGGGVEGGRVLAGIAHSSIALLVQSSIRQLATLTALPCPVLPPHLSSSSVLPASASHPSPGSLLISSALAIAWMTETGMDQKSTPSIIPPEAVCIRACLTGLETWQLDQLMSLGSGATCVSSVSTLWLRVVAPAIATVWRLVKVTKPVELMV